MKCLEKEPARRYATAAELAEDLERWLRGEPIQARTVGTAGRLSRWAQRHPGTAALLTTSILAVSALLVVQTVSRVRLARANREVRASNLRLSSSIYELRWRQADQAAQAEENPEAIAWFAYFLRQNPQDSAAAARLLSMLSARSFPVLRLAPLAHGAPVWTSISAGLETVSPPSLRKRTLGFGICNPERSKWNCRTGRPLTQCVLAGKGDRRLLTISSEPGAALWDLSSRQIIQEFKLGPVEERLIGRRLALTADRQWIGINARSNAVAVLDAESGQWILPPQTSPEEIQRIALSDDGRLFAIGSRLDVRLFDTRSARLLLAPVQLAAPPTDLRFSQDGRWLACSFEGKAWVMDTGTGVPEPEFRVNPSDSDIGWVSNTDRLLVGHFRTGLATVFNFRTGQNFGSAFGQAESAWFSHPSVASHSSSPKAATVGRCWTRARVLLNWSRSFMKDGFPVRRWIQLRGLWPAGAQDQTARVWSVGMQPVKPISIPVGDAAWEAQWSPSGQTILTTAMRGDAAEIGLWHASTGLPARPAQSGRRGDLLGGVGARRHPLCHRLAGLHRSHLGR